MASTIEDALKKELPYIVGKCKKVHYRQSMGVHKKTKNRLLYGLVIPLLYKNSK